ncbi:MAG: Spy/CpxP family protein refolding chaperone [Burkholderiales bacterium]
MREDEEDTMFGLSGKGHRHSIRPWARRGIIGAIGLASLGAVAGGMSGCSHHGPFNRGEYSEADSAQWRARGMERVSKELALDEAQKAKLNTLADVMQAKRKAVVGEGKPREMMQALVTGERFDRAGAQALVNSRSDAVRTASPEVIAAFGDFYDSLKPEQQQKVRDFIAKGPRRGPWGHHPMS